MGSSLHQGKRLQIALYTICVLFLYSSLSWPREPSPESLVMMAYISTLRCKAQHPKLQKGLDAAYKAWAKRNKMYVDSARKMLDFKAIAGQYKTLRKHDKHIPYQTCRAYIKRLQDPANDVHNPPRKSTKAASKK